VAGQLGIVHFLLEKGANPNIMAEPYGTCLHAEAFHGYIGIIELLLRFGAELNSEGGKLGYPIIAAAAGRNIEALELLIRAGAQVNSATPCIGPALTAAISADDANIHLRRSKTTTAQIQVMGDQLADFVHLMENPESLLQQQIPGTIPIFGHFISAVSREILIGPKRSTRPSDRYLWRDETDQMMACVKSRLFHRASPVNCKGSGVLPLQAAIRANNLWAVKTLLAAGADIPATPSLLEILTARKISRLERKVGHLNKPYLTPEEAEEASSNYLGLCRLFLDRGADVNAKSPSDGLTPLHMSWQEELVTQLLERGADIDGFSETGETPLMHAVIHAKIIPEYEKKVKLLLKLGADVNRCSSEGHSPLYYAIRRVSVSITETLLKTGANRGLRFGQAGDTPLHLAVRTIDHYQGPEVYKIAEKLLEAGEDATARNAHGETPLDLANHANLPLVMALLEAGVDPKEQEVTFVKAISRAAPRSSPGHLEVAQWLIDIGYDINRGEEAQLASGGGCNALLSLAANGPDNPERLAFLLRNGIDLQKFGQSALGLAIKNQNMVLARELHTAGVELPHGTDGEMITR
jgi:ankyrin repeat protein